MVFQEPMTALNPVMKCGDQVAEMLQIHTSMSKAERRARVLDIFTNTRLPTPERIYDSYPHQLSGGQRQRVMIAMALVLKPALLICDETTTALDVTTQAEILKLVRELQRENDTAVLFITHDFGVVADIADTVVVMRLGSMIEQGEKLDVLQRPKDAYTKMLLAAVPGLDPHKRAAVSDITPLIEANKISKTYKPRGFFAKGNSVHAAKEISLRIRPGETVGIVGESGSGKSTVARCIAGLIDASSGKVVAGDLKMEHASSKTLGEFRKKVQVVFQDPYRSLNPRQTVGDSIIEGAVNFGMPRVKALEKARDLMNLVRLNPDALDRFPHEFSGGQRQRICIARALACEPEVLIADEAVSALDVSVQAQILDLLDEIQARLKIGILFITHDLRVANQICDYILVMSQGSVVEEGFANDIFSAPAAEYTRSLIAAIPGRHFSFGSV